MMGRVVVVSFDRVSHDKLMARIETYVSDRRVLKLIRTFLKAGVLEGGLVSPVDEGTPQGGPLTPRTQKITWTLPYPFARALAMYRKNTSVYDTSQAVPTFPLPLRWKSTER